jgi:hypothetical protein
MGAMIHVTLVKAIMEMKASGGNMTATPREVHKYMLESAAHSP